MPRKSSKDYKNTRHYIPQILDEFHSPIKEKLRNLEERYIHEGRVVFDNVTDLRYVWSLFHFVEFECLLEINEQVCPRFILEFYSQYRLSYSDEGQMFVEFGIQNQYFSLCLEDFAQILRIPCEGACVFSDRWSLDELLYGALLEGPYQTNLPSPDDIISYVREDREGQVTRILHQEEIEVQNYQILTRKIVSTLKPLEEIIRENVFCLGGNRDHVPTCLCYMLYCVANSEKFNLAYFMAKRMDEYPELKNESYVLYDLVMTPLAAQLERKPRRDRGTRRALTRLNKPAASEMPIRVANLDYPYEMGSDFANYKYQDARGKRVANKEWPTVPASGFANLMDQVAPASAFANLMNQVATALGFTNALAYTRTNQGSASKDCKRNLSQIKRKKSKDHFAYGLYQKIILLIHKMTDQSDVKAINLDFMMENDESKKMQNKSKQQFEGFLYQTQSYDKGLTGVDNLSFDDLYNNLRVFENDVKGSTASSSSTQNVAFVSENTKSTNDVISLIKNGLEMAGSHDFYENEKGLHKDLSILQKSVEPREIKIIGGEMLGCQTQRLGYGDHRYYGILSYENEVLQSVFMSKESDFENQSLYDRFVTAGGMHAVPPPLIGNYMLSGPDIEIDYSILMYGPKQSQPSEFETQTSEFDTCESNISTETPELVSEPVVNEPNVVCQPKVWFDAPIIEEYEIYSEDEQFSTVRASGTNNVSTARYNFNKQAVPTNAAMKVNTVKPNVKRDYPHKALQNKGIVDSGCSRHMTRNKAYLAEYQDFNGGPVAFGGSKGYITGKEKRVRQLISSPGASSTPNFSPGTSSTPIFYPTPSTPPNYYGVSSSNTKCSNCKHLLGRIKVLQATREMHMHPEQHTLDSTALLHDLKNDMEKLGWE
ncbi:hypothetical protein Tco_1015920 [Tanacetum coccineum]|uniref:Retrovirus-related Pol polyprotein from transposon TNT 1-94-like beta-barrel domain-containing protein n=1 Tax=Tanacetum coccineum TaxID=301880 RepID=A0ABQ5FNF5_9ASTR